jgi:nicotinate-nucleotide adenylyltransferase
MTETLAIFGGSFDPPHAGHVLAAHYVLLTAPVSRVLVVPCAEHPFGKKHAPFEHRLAMCRIAFASLGGLVEVLDIEGRRQGPSYTIDTVRELARMYPSSRLELVVGSDIPEEMETWKDIEALRGMVTVRVLPRLEENAAAEESAQEVPYYLPRVSSGAIRRMAREGGDLSARVPRGVLTYIREHGLYQEERTED